jgi:hypothetical protein
MRYPKTDRLYARVFEQPDRLFCSGSRDGCKFLRMQAARLPPQYHQFARFRRSKLVIDTKINTPPNMQTMAAPEGRSP